MQNVQHQALALKYRPMTFEDVVGQEHVVRTLRNALASGRVANAYLFIGPRGIGKTTLSRIFAKALNCTAERDAQSVEPCGECENCREIALGSALDVVELDAASHNKVEDVKPIIDAVQFKPAKSRYKIFIVDECHMLSNAAWNALLKTLEEPPPYVKFIFATTEGDKVLATIVSRCQRFDLRRIQTHDIVARLRHICKAEEIDAAEDALLAIARGADGGMRDALSSLDQLISFRGRTITEDDALGVFALVSRSALESLAEAILKGDNAAILEAIDMFDSAGKNLRRLTGELLMHFRNLVVVGSLGPNAGALAATPEQIEVLKAQAALADAGRVFRICDQIADLDDKLRYALSGRTLVEMTLLRASRIATVATIEELMRTVRALQSAGAGGAAAQSTQQPKPAVAKKTEIAPKPEPPPKAEVAPEAKTTPAAKKTAASASDAWRGGGLPSLEELERPFEAPQPQPPPPQPTDAAKTRRDILDDPKLNAILEAVPGAVVTDIR